MSDPFVGPAPGSLPRQRSRPNLQHSLPAPPSSRSLASAFDTPSPPRNMAGLSSQAVRSHLQSLLEQKSSQLQMLGTMGQEILKQQTELEERIRGFENDEDDEEVGEGTKQKLTELDEAMRTWENQNEGMMRELGGKVGYGGETSLTLSCPIHRRQLPSPPRTLHPARSLVASATLSTAPWTWSSPLRSGRTS